MEEYIDKVMKAPLQVKLGGLAGLVLLLTALNFLLLVTPVDEQIVQHQSRRASLERTYAEKKETAQNLNERRRQMDALEQQLAEALAELPEKKDIEELLAQFNDVAKKSGLSIVSVEPRNETPAGFFSKIPVSMKVKGNYHEVAVFLQELTNIRRIVNVTDIDLGAPKMVGNKTVLDSNFMVTAFRFLDQASATTTQKGGGK